MPPPLPQLPHPMARQSQRGSGRATSTSPGVLTEPGAGMARDANSFTVKVKRNSNPRGVGKAKGVAMLQYHLPPRGPERKQQQPCWLLSASLSKRVKPFAA